MEFFQGVAAFTIPDNWKTGVKDPCYYEPDLNPTYHDWAEHYATVVIPARFGRPRDKAKVETGVLLVERWILAALRKRTFFSLAELNEAVRELLVRMNQRKFRKLDTTRARLFEELERPALKALPATPFTFAEWKKARANIDYHIEVDWHYYSVPYQLIHEHLDVCFSEKTVEVFHRGQRVALHVRSFVPGKHTTINEHRPPKHQDLEWTSSRFLDKGREIGPSTASLMERILRSRKLPELGYRSCMGVLRLAKRYSNERLEAAGICHGRFQHSPAVQGRVQITEAFWPYWKGGEQPSTDAADRFVAEVREILRERACIRPSFSTADEILARQWFSNAIPLERIRRAVLWGCGRKYVSWRNNQTYAPISSLAYFVPILDEIERQDIPDDYWDYILYRLERMEKLWIESFGKKARDSRLAAPVTGEIPQGGDVIPQSAKPNPKSQLSQTLTNSPGKKERR